MAFFCYLCDDMINTVRNTVMAILNKDNNGYITPEEFNLFAKQAQLEIFEQYFYDYTNWVNKRNARLANDGYANIQKNISETIDEFSTSSTLVYDAPSQSFALPADWYYVNVVLFGTKEIEYVAQNKVMNLLSSNITAPTTAYSVRCMFATLLILSGHILSWEARLYSTSQLLTIKTLSFRKANKTT